MKTQSTTTATCNDTCIAATPANANTDIIVNSRVTPSLLSNTFSMEIKI